MQSIKIYSNKEISELAEWYQSHIDNLPDSFQPDEAISYPHLKETVRIIIEQLPNLEGKPTFCGMVHLYFQLREKLIEQGYQ